MSEEKKLSVDPDKCIGCGACEGVAGEYFKMTDELSTVIKEYDEKDADIVNDAIDGCPVQAISLK